MAQLGYIYPSEHDTQNLYGHFARHRSNLKIDTSHSPKYRAKRHFCLLGRHDQSLSRLAKRVEVTRGLIWLMM